MTYSKSAKQGADHGADQRPEDPFEAAKARAHHVEDADATTKDRMRVSPIWKDAGEQIRETFLD
jgi:hypothetical protein